MQEWILKQDLFACFGACPIGDVDSNSNSNVRKREEEFNSNSNANYETDRSSDKRDNQSHHRLQKVKRNLPHLTTTKIVEQSCADPIPNFPTDNAVKAK